MHWKTKATIQRVLSVVPGGTAVNGLLQAAVRRSLGVTEQTFLYRARLALSHLDATLSYLARPVDAITAYEFGAGSDLIAPLTFAARGVRRQVVADQSILLRPSAVGDVLKLLARHREALGVGALPEIHVRPVGRLIRELESAIGIRYRAPLDAAATGLPSGSIDLITSNSTLEHVPRGELDALLSECRRVLRDDGVVCFRIDYEDHYAILDDAISPYNFLRFGERAWSRFNSKLQFQNRLRHRDYVARLAKSGFEALRVETLEPSAQVLAELERMPVAEEFRSYTLAELGTRKGTFLLKRR
jgi:SAM-dependent methyltransferase